MKQPQRLTHLLGLAVAASVLAAACGPTATAVPTAAPTSQPTSAPTAAPDAQTPDLVKAFQEAYNAHDADGVMALLSDEPQMGFGAFSFAPVGAKAVRNVLEFQFATNTRLELSECSTADGIVSCKMANTDDCVPAAVGAIHYDARFIFTEGKISLIFSQLNAGEAGWDTLVGAVFGWANTTNSLAEDYATLWSNDADWDQYRSGDASGSTHSASEMGQAWDRLCKGYAEANN